MGGHCIAVAMEMWVRALMCEHGEDLALAAERGAPRADGKLRLNVGQGGGGGGGGDRTPAWQSYYTFLTNTFKNVPMTFK